MKNFYHLLVCVAVLAVGCHPASGVDDDFVLCTTGKILYRNIAMDYGSWRGQFADVSGPIEYCVPMETTCIKFPILFSVPPRIPVELGDTVQWSAGSAHFTFKIKSEMREDIYELSANDVIYSYTYTYDSQRGVMQMTMKDEDGSIDTWRRCKGNLRFSDLAFDENIDDKTMETQ